MEEELRIRISYKLKTELEAKARELNISLSAYVRMQLSSNDKNLEEKLFDYIEAIQEF